MAHFARTPDAKVESDLLAGSFMPEPGKSRKPVCSRAPAAHMTLEQERKVYVGNTGHTISIRRQSAAVWVAAGEYMGELLETRGPTQGAAVRLWIRVARYKTTSSHRQVARATERSGTQSWG
jgi:hypothetical protein